MKKVLKQHTNGKKQNIKIQAKKIFIGVIPTKKSSYMNISFKRLIPVASCNIINNTTQQTEPAVLYEYDCQTPQQDICEINSLPDIFFYKDKIAQKMEDKYEKTMLWHMHDGSRFYSLKNTQGQILGILYTYDGLNGQGKDTVVIDRIQSNTKAGYKYVGQAMLAALCKLNQTGSAESILVKSPALTAENFYIDKCGFKRVPNHELELSKQDYDNLISSTEEKTHGNIDLTV